MRFGCLGGIVLLLQFVCETSHASPPLEVGARKQLFLDDYIVAERPGLTRTLGVVTKANDGKPIMKFDEPWESPYAGFYGTVLHDGQKFRMWYRAFPGAVAYAESVDG